MKKRTILLTGVTQGLGRSLLNGFDKLGHTVLGCGQNVDRLEELKGRFPKPHHFSGVDVSSFEEVEAWAKNIFAMGYKPDLILNNAGYINPSKVLWEIPPEEFAKVMRINVEGVVHVIRSFTPSLIRAGAGVIVNFSSGWGRSSSPLVAPYCASKWAIEGLNQSFAQELPAGIATVAVNPGVINTNMLRRCWGEHAADFHSPEEWSKNAVNFLLALNHQNNGDSISIT